MTPIGTGQQSNSFFSVFSDVSIFPNRLESVITPISGEYSATGVASGQKPSGYAGHPAK